MILFYVLICNLLTLAAGSKNLCSDLEGCFCTNNPTFRNVTCNHLNESSLVFQALHNRFPVIRRLEISNVTIDVSRKGFLNNLTVHTIILSRCDISNIEDWALTSINGLRRLTIERSNLTAIPLDIRHLPNITLLCLKHNSIPCLNCTDLPASKQLADLDISNNCLRSIENGTFDDVKMLANLYLNNNLLEWLDKGIFDALSQLKKFDLSNNKITSFEGLFTKLNPQV